MNRQLSQTNLKKRIVACSDTLSQEALNWLFFGIIGFPMAAMATCVCVFDWNAIETLPKAHGFIYVLVGLCLIILPVLVLVWLFPAIARRLFAGVYRITLHENGLTILAHKEKGKYYQYNEFDSISTEQSDEEITLCFSKGQKKWVFILDKHKNESAFTRVVHLAAKFG